MTPTELATYARQQYNATNDDFFSDEEMFGHIKRAQNILARECKAIENTYSTPTVADQQEYTWPTNAWAIKRVTYNGGKLTKISFREDDFLTGFNQDSGERGTPTHYAIFDRTIYLRPVPDAVYDLKLFTFDVSGDVTSSSDLAIDAEWHEDLATYLLWKMAAKDNNLTAAAEYKDEWLDVKARCLAWSRRRQTADGFNVVRDEASLDPLLTRRGV